MKWPIIAAAALAGCALSTRVLSAGPDTYQLSEHMALIRGGLTAAEASAMTEADNYCRALGPQHQFLPSVQRNKQEVQRRASIRPSPAGVPGTPSTIPPAIPTGKRHQKRPRK